MDNEITVVLAPHYNRSFRRGVRGEDGTIESMLIFEQKVPVRLSKELYSAIAKDIGGALLVCVEGEGGRWVANDEATKKFAEEVKSIPAQATKPPKRVAGKATAKTKLKKKKVKKKSPVATPPPEVEVEPAKPDPTDEVQSVDPDSLSMGDPLDLE